MAATKEDRASKKLVADITSVLVQTDGVTVNQIAATIGAGRSTVGKALAQLEKDGSARRESASGDSEEKGARWFAVAEEARPPKPAKAATPRAVSDGERMGRGALREAVLNTLMGRAGTEMSPVEISKFLGGKSVGAVTNALEKLAGQGVITRTQDKPRRFMLKAVAP